MLKTKAASPHIATTTRRRPQSNFVFHNHHQSNNDDQSEILKGLNKKYKTINPKYFYDTVGSELFEQITQLEEYYPTRTERAILNDNLTDIAEYCGTHSVVIEPGSGSSEKIKLLLDTLQPKAYVPIDIAADFLQQAATQLAAEYPWLFVQALCADFGQFIHPPQNLPDGKRVIFYPGSTIGNMTPELAQQFLQTLRNWIQPFGGILIGVDTHKSSHCLNRAYNDKKGITEKFNLNALNNINRIAQASFDTHNFTHRAHYNEDLQRIEMHLESQVDHIVRIGSSAVAFQKGESIHTENSYKYTPENFTSLAKKAGLSVTQKWQDDKQLFAIYYLECRSAIE